VAKTCRDLENILGDIWLTKFLTMTLSAADSDPGSGAFLTPGSKKGFVRIPKPYFREFGDNVLDKNKTYISLPVQK
jgi:hypothetical protein